MFDRKSARIEPKTMTDEGINEGIKTKLSATYNYIKTHPGCNIPLIAKETGIPIKTIERYVRTLMAKELIIHRGSNKIGGYYTQ